MHNLRFAQQVDMKSEIANVCNFVVLVEAKAASEENESKHRN